MTTFSEVNTKFALDFYRLLSRAHLHENILFCPVNLISALGLLLYGSRSDTAAEIEKMLYFDELAESELRGHTSHSEKLHSDDVKHKVNAGPKEHDKASPPSNPSKSKENTPWCPPCEQVPDYVCEKPEGVHSLLNKVLKELNKPSTDYELSIANRLFADESIHFFQKFLYCALKLYLTEVDRIDIHNAPEDVRKLINLWVEVRTHGKIKDLLHKNSFNCEADLLLVNTLYFKGQWEVRFDKELTSEAPFYFNEDQYITVQMMYRKGQFNIGRIESSGAQVLEIPYKNNKLSLFILLPKDNKMESLQQLEDELTQENLLNWGSILKPAEVHVGIPKLSIEKSIEANTYFLPHLTNPEKADLSGATSTEGVVLTHLFHDTYIEIDEEGGEELGKTYIPKDRHLARRAPLQFMANVPFLYYIQDKSTLTFLAFGKFTKPEENF